MKMNTIDSVPMNTVAWTREKRGKTLEKSRPVPYREVVPVDMPPIRAMRQTGRWQYLAGRDRSRPPT
ncbi:hypothetical protein GCM10020220_095730 [Nonomuraea rubra]